MWLKKELSQPATADAIKAAERTRIKSRRAAAEKEGIPVPDNTSDTLVGLALSGGGIRSAAFNLGVLQVLERWGYLKQFDYLSTVSGGGYIGSCMTWFGSVLGKEFPLVWASDTQPGEREKERERVRMIRESGSYLAPGDGLNLWSLIAATITGALSTMIVIVPVLFLFIALLAYENDLLFGLARTIGYWLLGIFAAGSVLIGAIFGLSLWRYPQSQKAYRKWCGRALAAGVLLIIIGLIPLLIGQIREGWELLTSLGVTLGGVTTTLLGLFKSKPGDEVKPKRSFLLTVGVALIAYGVFIAIYHTWQGLVAGHGDTAWTGLFVALAFSAAIALFANINNLSMHRYYRNRLMEAFLPDKNPDGSKIDRANPDKCRLCDIPQTAYPYHIINANQQTTGSKTKQLRQRGGESFVFSAEYCGSRSTEYVKTSEYLGGKTNLATAMAVSGAAADTNSYATRSIPLTFLMSLVNARLGYWILNPRFADKLWRIVRPTWYWYLLRDSLGIGLDERSRFIHLSDGGHFENLGLYELVSRGCSHIVACDAGCDPDFTFSDIGRAVERIRADFAVTIDMPLAELVPSKKTGLSKKPYAIGKIKYGKQKDGTVKNGVLIYIKTAVTKESYKSPEVRSYKSAHKKFPDESTADQFFDEKQFEAYRELGYRIGETVFRKDPSDPSRTKVRRDLLEQIELLVEDAEAAATTS